MAAFLPAIVGAGVSAASSVLSNPGSQETRMQRTKRKLVDQVLSSLQGRGPFNDIFNYDEKAFQKSFVDPAKAMFQNQIAPQIQQQYIATGQQRGTGLDDQLLRAGVDLDQLLNQHMLQYQEAGKNRAAGAISNIYGVGDGAPPGLSAGQAAIQGLGGYFSSPGFSDTLGSLFNKPSIGGVSAPSQPGGISRKGFAPDPAINFGTPVGGR